MDLNTASVMTKERLSHRSRGMRVDGIVRFTMENLSQLPVASSAADYRQSESVQVQDVTWTILLGRLRQRVSNQRLTTLSIWVKCQMPQFKSWFCCADLQFRLVSQHSGQVREQDCICWRKRQLFAKYGDEERPGVVQVAGFPDFDDFDEICKPENGFVADDSIYVEVVVQDMRSFEVTDALLPEPAVIHVPGNATDEFPLLLNNPFVSDVTFRVKGCEFHAHRLVLALRSPAMFDMLCIRQPDLKVLTADKLDPSAFFSLLSLLYCKRLLLTPSNLMSVFTCAMYFGRTDAMHACLSLISPENVFAWCRTAVHCSNDLLYDACIRVLARNADHLLRTDDWLAVHRRVVKTLTVQDELNMREIDLFEAVCRWAEREARDKKVSVKEVADDLLHNIRFPTMEKEEFRTGPENRHLLTDADVRHIQSYFLYGEASPDLKFSVIRRRSIPPNGLTLSSE